MKKTTKKETLTKLKRTVRYIEKIKPISEVQRDNPSFYRRRLIAVLMNK